MSHSKLSTIRWCPWCGVDHIERDSHSPRPDIFEYLCLACGAGFRLIESKRVQQANLLMRETRKLRVPTGTLAHELAMVQDQYRAICHKKFKEFQMTRKLEWQQKVGDDMMQWLESEEAQALRGDIEQRIQAIKDFGVA